VAEGDEALVAAVRDGSERAFNELVDRHQQAVRTFLRGVTSYDDADDMAQETFLAVWTHARSYRGGNVRAWLFWAAIQTHGELVHVPPSGTWGHGGSPVFAPARSWVGTARARAVGGDARVHLVRRYLAAFGPASVADLNSWSQARNLRPVLAELEPQLRRFRDEAGRLLLDLKRAPLVDGDVPAPVRFLPKWDTAILGYAPPERWRILPERYRKRVIAVNGDVKQTFTVDGLIAGTWDVEPGRRVTTLALRPFSRLSTDARAELTQEGALLLRFVDPDAASYAVRVGS
jgi:hypothetical protein